MSAWHLLWIIPLAWWFGFAACAIFTMARDADDREERWRGEK